MIKAPDEIFGPLFEAVQLSGIFFDSKTFVDSTPKAGASFILNAYKEEYQKDGFDLKVFVENHFEIFNVEDSSFQHNPDHNPEQHISALWPVLKRQADKDIEGSSLIPLKHDYIVPGGRFGEIYYWDSYFTMEGLRVSGEVAMIESMIQNFADLIDTIGYIPNGNRSYFLGRSQPPFFARMITLLAEIEGDAVILKYQAQLLKEYQFWTKSTSDHHDMRMILLPDGNMLNRYSDNKPIPRQESYVEDVELAEGLDKGPAQVLWRHLRGACESGWDFSSRWMDDSKDLGTIRCRDIIPIDLNCLMYHLELTIARTYELEAKYDEAAAFKDTANQRKEAIHKWLWSAEKQIFLDYDVVNKAHKDVPSAAMLYPLFFELATETQAYHIAQYIENNLLKEGGIVTTEIHSGQQWDAPNGWAPLQWIAVIGLEKYGHHDLARSIATRWTSLNERVYNNTGKFVEKYNVEDLSLEAGGGEYPVQDGFGWTNGVYLALKEWLQLKG